MTSVQNLAEQIVAREGGFVNDPDDPGGATNFGVTLHTLRRLRPHQQVCVDDVRALTRDDAVTIYVEHYFTRPPHWRSARTAMGHGVRHVCERRGQCGAHLATLVE